MNMRNIFLLRFSEFRLDINNANIATISVD